MCIYSYYQSSANESNIFCKPHFCVISLDILLLYLEDFKFTIADFGKLQNAVHGGSLQEHKVN